MFAMLSTAIGSIVGSFFIARDISALSAAYPIQALMTAFAIAVGIGSGSALSRAIGQGDEALTKRTAAGGTALILGTLLPVTALGIAAAFLLPAVFDLNAEEVDGAKIYLIIISAAFPMTAVHTVFNRIAVSEGVTVPPMIAAISGTAVTVAIDFLLFNVETPLSGMAKLAVADAVGQGVTLIAALIIAKRLPITPFIDKRYLPDKKVFAEIIKVSLPSAVQNGIDAMFSTALNAILGGAAIAFYGAFYKVRQQALTPIYGLNQGTVPILGAAFGNGDKARFKKVFVISSSIALGIAAAVTIAAECSADKLLNLFDITEDVNHFRILAGGFVPAAAALMISAAFVATGQGGKAMALNLLRGAGIGIPAALILRNLPTGYTWIALAAAEFVAVAIFIPIAVKSYKNTPLKAGQKKQK